MVQPSKLKLLVAVFLLTAFLLSAAAFSVGIEEDVGAPPDTGLLPGEEVGAPPNVGGASGEEVGVPPNVGGSAPPSDDGDGGDGGGGGYVAPVPVPVITFPAPPVVIAIPSAAPVPSPAPQLPKAVPPNPLSGVEIRQPLFMRSLGIADSDCVAPGEPVVLAFNVHNSGKTTLNDVRFTASVPELGIYASSGPIKLTTKDMSLRFLKLDIPQDADDGAYYIRFTVSNNKFKRAVHRVFSIDKGC